MTIKLIAGVITSCLLIQITSCQDPAAVQLRCCDLGQASAKSWNCETSFIPDPDLNADWNNYCLNVFDGCCNRRRDENYCEQGKEVAEMGGDCGNITMTGSGSVMVQRCCMACEAGKDAARASGTCSIQSMNVEDTAHVTCCNIVTKGIKTSAVKDDGAEEEDEVGPEMPTNLIEIFTETRTEEPEVVDATEFCEKCSHGCVDDEDGNPKCTCSSGFELDTDLKSCIDRDECLENPCKEEEICQNLIGAFECLPTAVECPSGSVKKPVPWWGHDVCVDINECAIGTHNCSKNEDCINTNGSFTCRCKSGFELNLWNKCEDIDECQSWSETCLATQVCINTPGSFECHCKDGYELSKSGTCDNINECASISDACHENQVCIDEIGSYACLCQPDWTMNGDGSCSPPPVEGPGHDETHSELNQEVNPVPCHGISDANNSCSCPDGFKLVTTDDHKTCVDIDECLSNPCLDDEECINTFGGHKCVHISCPSTYRLVGGNICEDPRLTNCTIDRKCFKPFRKPIRIIHSMAAIESNITMAKLYEINHLDKPVFFFRGLINIKISFDWEENQFLDPQNEEYLNSVVKMKENFRIVGRGNKLILFLIKPIQGPKELIVDVDVEDGTKSWLGIYERHSVHVFVSKFDGINFSK